MEVENSAGSQSVEIPEVTWLGVSRGIVVGGLYATVLLLALQYMGKADISRSLGGTQVFLFAIAGFLGATICGFSRASQRGDVEAGSRKLDAAEVLIMTLWFSVLVLLANLIEPFLSARNVSILVFAGLGGAMLGVLVGQPVFRFAGRITIKGRRPFLFVNDLTQKIKNEEVRFYTRLVVQTILLGTVIVLATFTILIVLFIVMMGVMFWILSFVMGGGGPSLPASRPAQDPGGAPEDALTLPLGSRINKDGEIVTGIFGGSTGYRINKDGDVVKGVFGSSIGINIDKDGRIRRKGFIFSEATGLRFKPNLDGSMELVKEGIVGDTSTGYGLGKDGHAQKRGFILAQTAGFSIGKDGSVRPVDENGNYLDME